MDCCLDACMCENPLPPIRGIHKIESKQYLWRALALHVHIIVVVITTCEHIRNKKAKIRLKKTFHYRTEVTPKIEKYNLFTYKRHTAKPLNCFIHRFMHHLQKQLFFFLGREYRCMRKYYIVRKETIRVTISMAFSYVLRFLFFSDVSSSSILFEKSQFSLH